MKFRTLTLGAIAALLFACNTTTPLPETTTPVVSVERGENLVTTLGCNDCHSPKMMTPMGPAIDSGRMLSGHSAEEMLPPYDKQTASGYVLFSMGGTAMVGPWGTSFAANISADSTGIGGWTEAQFMKAMKEGKWKGLDNTRPLLPPMPWQGYSKLSDDELMSIFAYLKSVPAVKNVVPAPLPPQLAD